MAQARNSNVAITLAYRFLTRVTVFVVLWWAFIDGYSGSWSFGVPFVLLAAIVSLVLSYDKRISVDPIGFVRYLLFFFYHTAQSGVAVAALALKPSMPVDPDYIRYPFRIEDETARVLVADSATLLPGTLSAGIEGDTLILHAIACDDQAVEDVFKLEERVASMLRLEITDHGRPVVIGV